jgi:hypothetical protein
VLKTTLRCFEKKSVFFIPEKIGAIILHCVIFGVFFKKMKEVKNNENIKIYKLDLIFFFAFH